MNFCGKNVELNAEFEVVRVFGNNIELDLKFTIIKIM